MSLIVKHLNNDASFLLTFYPTDHDASTSTASSKGFTIVLDPWLIGKSKIWHNKFSVSTHTEKACITSLAEIPEPDLVIISQDKEDHCHAQTLKTLSATSQKTTILAEPGAAKVIRGWKYFAQSKVQTLPKWHERKEDSLYRIPIPALDEDGTAGEVTIAFVKQAADITGLHAAICITYRPPTAGSTGPLPCTILTPGWSPSSPAALESSTARSVASSECSLASSADSTYTSSTASSLTPAPSSTLSVIFSPHGLPYASLAPYVTSHLLSQSALPLTCLLHCFDKIYNPFYMGGVICTGLEGGAEIAEMLSARCWISAHDGDKATTGFATRQTKMRRSSPTEVNARVNAARILDDSQRDVRGTDVRVLGVGEQLCLRL